jgi:hypothetical protein
MSAQQKHSAWNILKALDDPKVFGAHFGGATWDMWRVFLAALFALSMTAGQLALYQKHTGRTAPPTVPFREAWVVCGRRGGKSFTLATIAVFLACFKDWRPYLGPGEFATIMIISRDRKSARVIKRFITGLLHAVPMLERTIEGETADGINLKNRVAIEIHTASFREVRGYTVAAALLDELAFWPVDASAAEPDVEVLAAIRPAMSTVPDAMLLCASSPYARRGTLWDAYRKHFGKDGDPVFVWQAATHDMNPSVPQAEIDAALADDYVRNAAEYLAEFRSDLEAFVLREALEACIARHCFEREPVRGVAYRGFCDPSGGVGDSMTLAIAHYETADQTVVLDAVREAKPPFSPEAVCEEFATLLKSYGVGKICGDRFAGQWPIEQFGKFGIQYEPSARPRSELYLALQPLINSGRLTLLDHPKLISQLLSLECHTGRGGRDSIDHPPGLHDDLANALAGVASITNSTAANYAANLHAAFGESAPDPVGINAWRSLRLATYLESGGRVKL